MATRWIVAKSAALLGRNCYFVGRRRPIPVQEGGQNSQSSVQSVEYSKSLPDNSAHSHEKPCEKNKLSDLSSPRSKRWLHADRCRSRTNCARCDEYMTEVIIWLQVRTSAATWFETPCQRIDFRRQFHGEHGALFRRLSLHRRITCASIFVRAAFTEQRFPLLRAAQWPALTVRKTNVPAAPSATDNGDGGSSPKLRGLDSNPQGAFRPAVLAGVSRQPRAHSTHCRCRTRRRKHASPSPPAPMPRPAGS